MTPKFVVQYPDERYYREGKAARHFMHNASKMSLRKATQVAADTNGTVKPAAVGTVTLGC